MGQQVVEFMTNEGEGRKITCQMTEVNKILACVAMICDAKNHVLYSRNGGWIIPEKDVKILVKEGAKVTPFSRKGNTYVMDAWVRKPATENKKTGFSRPGMKN